MKCVYFKQRGVRVKFCGRALVIESFRCAKALSAYKIWQASSQLWECEPRNSAETNCWERQQPKGIDSFEAIQKSRILSEGIWRERRDLSTRRAHDWYTFYVCTICINIKECGPFERRARNRIKAFAHQTQFLFIHTHTHTHMHNPAETFGAAGE